MKRIISICIVLSMLFLAGCAPAAPTEPTEPSAPEQTSPTSPTETLPSQVLNSHSEVITDFGVRLFQRTIEGGKNVMISPVSIMCALAMAANGAQGETLAQMERVLGLSTEELNQWVQAYLSQLPSGEDYMMHLANGIWFKDDPMFTVDQDFLQTNTDYYGAVISKSPFDSTTVDEINRWVEQNTNGMIPEIINEIPDQAVMYLVNALAFDAVWEDRYHEGDIRDSIFTTEDGRKLDAEMMHSEESLYLEDEKATGFMKYYADQKYAFVALLPNEGISISDYVNSLSGEHLHELLSEPQDAGILTETPKFESEYSTELSESLMEMGMTDAFDWVNADFGRMGSLSNGNLAINQVLHKTTIRVDATGTKASAVTSIEWYGAAAGPGEYKTVILNRPFVYMIIDCETNLPLFMGAMMDVSAQ